MQKWLLEYILVEMLGIGEPGVLEPPGQQATSNVKNFLLVPIMLEKLVILGIFVLSDSFLYVFTFLPIRVVFSVMLVMKELFASVLQFLVRKLTHNDDWIFFKKVHDDDINPPFLLRFHRTHLYDLMRGLLLFLGYSILRKLDMSKVYHYIRGQNVIKLYVLSSMMEIMDKLLRYRCPKKFIFLPRLISFVTC
jgi:hypothetical protein